MHVVIQNTNGFRIMKHFEMSCGFFFLFKIWPEKDNIEIPLLKHKSCSGVGPRSLTNFNNIKRRGAWFIV